jgi:hypothetical protein
VNSANPPDILAAIAFVAERKIEEAIAEGKLDKLPGAGKPILLEDLSHIPPEMRMAYTILRASSHLEEAIPPERLPPRMDDLLSAVPEEQRVYGKMRRLKLMLARVRKSEKKTLPEQTGKPRADAEKSPYLEKLVGKI